MTHTSGSATRFSAEHINQTIQRALASAGLDTSTGPLHGVTETIRRALGAALPSGAPPDLAPREFLEPAPNPAAPRGRTDRSESALPGALDLPGRFIRGEFSNQAGTRAYKLYVPSDTSESPRPLVVMLHGCTQSADDFARGTQMNSLAHENGFLVLYPEQSPSGNVSKCWNWFQPQDQQRDKGEPSLIAGMVVKVAREYGLDERRIFVAGLSAGAAMAVVLGQTYPDIFAAVGAHSGLPFASANDIPSAMAAMKGGRGRGRSSAGPTSSPADERTVKQAVPTIVFHGDRDHTVQHLNGAAIAKHVSAAYGAGGSPAAAELLSSTERGDAGGRAFSRAVLAAPDGRPCLEFWTLHGAGHAWSGGDASGSYTDSTGPNASAEMVRFFLAQPRAGSA